MGCAKGGWCTRDTCRSEESEVRGNYPPEDRQYAPKKNLICKLLGRIAVCLSFFFQTCPLPGSPISRFYTWPWAARLEARLKNHSPMPDNVGWTSRSGLGSLKQHLTKRSIPRTNGLLVRPSQAHAWFYSTMTDAAALARSPRAACEVSCCPMRSAHGRDR
jgi:hypothetical protein